ncbi:PRC-barrel domain-containing protein [Sulfitobacter sp.]|jgi:sporulation protein YlmC with PRC-barrel domain|uniref:PRC-barrel domain-containing protein n=1 Tax=Sulfitobacter sp. TaxID=1903071 RepID=UPI0039E51848
MKRFLGTTAIILSLTGPAFAASHAANGIGSTVAQPSDFFASDLIGMRIYNSESDVDTNMTVANGAETEWDDIGEINDILLDENGDVKAVILGIGGFLGMGERDVTVSMDSIKVLRSEDDADDRFLVVTTSKEMLEQAPEFERAMDDDMDHAATSDHSATSEMNNEAAAEERTMLTRPTVAYEGYANAEVEEMQALTADDLEGAYVYGANNETVGEVESLILGDDGQVKEVVINVGGFLGLGEKPVAVTWDELQVLKNAEGDDFRIYIDSSEEALEAQPEYRG